MSKYYYWKKVWSDLKSSRYIRIGWMPIGVIGSVIAYFLTDTGEKVIHWKNVVILIGFVVGWIFFVALLIMIKHFARYIHNAYVDSLYGGVISNLTQINYQLKTLNKGKTIADEDLMKVLKKVCNDLKSFFDKKTHASCCVSIKVTISKDGDIASWKFRNLCRDDKNKSRDTEQYKSANHTVIGNTPYTHVANQLDRHSTKVAYVNNNIPSTQGYLNTSKFDDNTELPYKSEMVYPIMPLKVQETKPEMCGFLCVDCDKVDKFDEKRYDIPILESVIDNLYEVLIKKIESRANEEQV